MKYRDWMLLLIMLQLVLVVFAISQVEGLLHDHLHELNDVLIPELIEVCGG